MNKHYKVEYMCSVPNEKDSKFVQDGFDLIEKAKNWIIAEIANMMHDDWWYGGKRVKSYKIIEVIENEICSYDIK